MKKWILCLLILMIPGVALASNLQFKKINFYQGVSKEYTDTELTADGHIKIKWFSHEMPSQNINTETTLSQSEMEMLSKLEPIPQEYSGQYYKSANPNFNNGCKMILQIDNTKVTCDCKSETCPPIIIEKAYGVGMLTGNTVQKILNQQNHAQQPTK